MPGWKASTDGKSSLLTHTYGAASHFWFVFSENKQKVIKGQTPEIFWTCLSLIISGLEIKNCQVWHSNWQVLWPLTSQSTFTASSHSKPFFNCCVLQTELVFYYACIQCPNKVKSGHHQALTQAWTLKYSNTIFIDTNSFLLLEYWKTAEIHRTARKCKLASVRNTWSFMSWVQSGKKSPSYSELQN